MNDVTIIGAGIVGLATAVKLVKHNSNLKLTVVEKEKDIAIHQTGNNSGVIHSGIYYKPGSLKAINCKRGYDMLLEFCNQNEINYEICGKIIVAVNQKELEQLEKIYQRGIENGLTGLKILRKDELKEKEPYVRGIKGIFVPQTGIIDFKQVSKKYAEFITNKNCEIKLNTEVINIVEKTDHIEIITNNKTITTKYLVTCAGLHSDRIARMTNPEIDIKIIPFRGEYFKIKDEKKHLVKSLIYPVPDPTFPFL